MNLKVIIEQVECYFKVQGQGKVLKFAMQKFFSTSQKTNWRDIDLNGSNISKIDSATLLLRP